MRNYVISNRQSKTLKIQSSTIRNNTGSIKFWIILITKPLHYGNKDIMLLIIGSILMLDPSWCISVENIIVMEYLILGNGLLSWHKDGKLWSLWLNIGIMENHCLLAMIHINCKICNGSTQNKHSKIWLISPKKWPEPKCTKSTTTLGFQ